MSWKNLETHSTITAGPIYLRRITVFSFHELERPAVVDAGPLPQSLASNELS
jgi:hypothetical protein